MDSTRLSAKIAALALSAAAAAALPAGEADLSRDGIGITVAWEPDAVDPARDFFVTATFETPAGAELSTDDLRGRFRGFRVAEDFVEDPVTAADGKVVRTSRWRLVPEPAAEKYRLAPFVVAVAEAGRRTAEFCTASVKFPPPAPREPVTGEMELDPQRDLPPLTWKTAGLAAAALALAVLLVWGIVKLIAKISMAVKVHRMSPIERAMHELGLLLGKGLPGRGLYKDFYVELTMVVRRYIERRHAVKAPNLTTWEFLEAAKRNSAFAPETVAELKTFLESADMVKFAGVDATPAMADEATDRARGYLRADNAQGAAK